MDTAWAVDIAGGGCACGFAENDGEAGLQVEQVAG